MSRQIQIRRGTAAEHNDFTGAIGEITMDTTNNSLRVHDGSTVGGHNILNETKITEKLSEKANKDGDNFTSTGKINIANMSMPSINVTNISVGVSGTNYTSGVDGYIALYPIFSSNGYCGIAVKDQSNHELYGTLAEYSGVQAYQTMFIPISKGNIFTIFYSNVGSWGYSRIIRLNGAN